MIRATIGDLQQRLGVDYVTASSLVKLMVSQGQGKEAGKRATATGKGKPSTIYELSEKFELSLTAPVAPAPVKETAPVQVAPVAPTPVEESVEESVEEAPVAPVEVEEVAAAA